MNNPISNETSFTKLKEFYQLYLSKQQTIHFYPSEFLPFRPQLIEWMVFLCQNLSFKPETLFLSISLLDHYISQCYSEISFNFSELKLITVSCLSIATKIEEINCNFITFLTDKVLNSEGEQFYTSSQLASKEIEILKGLSFFTNYVTPFNFLSILIAISEEVFGKENESYLYISNMSIFFLTQTVKSKESLCVSSKDLALYAFNQALLQLNTIGPQNHVALNAIWSLIQKISLSKKESKQYKKHNDNVRRFRQNSDDMKDFVYYNVEA